MLGDWKWRWGELLYALDRVEQAYLGQPGGSVPAQHDVQSFLLWSDVLVEWVADSIGRKPSELRDDIARLADPWLAIASDLAVMVKHTTRTYRHLAGDPTLGTRVSQSVKLLLGDDPIAAVEIVVDYTARDGTTARIDVLDLARNVVAQWRVFLPTLGLTLP